MKNRLLNFERNCYKEYRQRIHDVTNDYFKTDWRNNRCGEVYNDDEFGNHDCEYSHTITMDDYHITEIKKYKVTDYIKKELSEDLKFNRIEQAEFLRQNGLWIPKENLITDDDTFKMKVPIYFEKQKFEYISTLFDEYFAYKFEAVYEMIIKYNGEIK
jgi:hypothetical protein